MTPTETALTGWNQDWERPTEKDWARVLAGIPLFARLGNRQLRELVRSSFVAEYVKGDVVLLAGERPDFLYVILSGTARVVGKPETRVMRDGDYFGELALLDGRPRSASVVADGELHVIKIPAAAFREAIERDPEIAVTIMRELTQRLRRAERAAR
jgi:CRP/FNR family transcriptional regulator, cyclic AMP receptor protein